jgi:hypothetical protein
MLENDLGAVFITDATRACYLNTATVPVSPRGYGVKKAHEGNRHHFAPHIH